MHNTNSRNCSSSSAAFDRGLSDVDLLRQFVEDRNQQAMAAIIARHGSLVMGVCRRVLRNDHDAADAFQATFLVLLKKANSIGKVTSLAGWLYSVAHRVANKARSQSSWRQKREGSGLEMNPAVPPNEPVDEETVGLIHEELCNLPENFRLPLILCCLEGEAREDAAEHLGWTLGSLKGRLERGRELLLARLKRRGVVLSVAALAGAFAQQATAAEVPAALASSTVSTLTLVVAGQSLIGGTVSAHTAALTQGVLKAMFIAKLKVAGVVLITGGVVATGSAVVVQRVFAAPPAANKPLAGKGENVTEKQKVEFVKSEDGIKLAEAGTKEAAGGEKQIDKDDEERLIRRQKSMNNIKQLGLAMHGYNADHGTFPAAASYGQGGKPLLSWRVLILPYIDQVDLYKQFKLEEPWDSPHNKKLLEKMPEIYRAPGMEKEHPTETFYQVFTGPGTPFEGQRGLAIKQFKDGTSNTILAVEARTPVPWTKPADIAYDAEKPLPKLGGVFKDGFCALVGDGAARFVPRDISDADLRPWITPAAKDVSGQF
jgi:RNA polymerase sigma factor (sigma-70 family)